MVHIIYIYLCVYTHVKFQQFCHQYDLNINHLKLRCYTDSNNSNVWMAKRDSLEILARTYFFFCPAVLRKEWALAEKSLSTQSVVTQTLWYFLLLGDVSILWEDWRCSLGFGLVGTRRKLQEDSAHHQTAESSVWYFLAPTLVSLMKTRAALGWCTGRTQGPEGGEQARGLTWKLPPVDRPCRTAWVKLPRKPV